MARDHIPVLGNLVAKFDDPQEKVADRSQARDWHDGYSDLDSCPGKGGEEVRKG